MQETERYQNKHATRILLDEYHGVASDILFINEPVADGFMRVADLRKNIVVVGKSGERTSEYEQVGSTRVDKMHKIPIFRKGQTSNSNVHFDSGAWYVGVDDQAISRKAAEKATETKRFDDIFTGMFKREVSGRIEEVLLREKIAAQGYDTHETIVTYGSLALTPLGIAQGILLSGGIDKLVDNPAHLAVMAAGLWLVNTTVNAFRTQGVVQARGDHPFVRENMLEAPLPAVPIDRVARGVTYLKMHGNQIVERQTA